MFRCALAFFLVVQFTRKHRRRRRRRRRMFNYIFLVVFRDTIYEVEEDSIRFRLFEMKHLFLYIVVSLDRRLSRTNNEKGRPSVHACLVN